MRYAALIALMFLTTLCVGQDLSGHWVGELPPATIELKYKIEMDMIRSGDSLSGKTRYTAGDYWVVQNFKGTINGTDIYLEEYSVNGCNCINGVRFCLKKMKGTLTTDAAKGEMKIEGTWASDRFYDGKNYINAPCAPGKFFITKSVPPVVKPVTSFTPPAAPVLKSPLTLPLYDGKGVTKSYSVLRPMPLYPTRKKDPRPLDGHYERHHIDSSKMTSYAPLREADVAFQKRIWLEIDVREKFNNYMAAPKARLIDAMLEAVTSGQLIAYDPTPTAEDPGGDMFYHPLKPAAAMARLADSSLVTKRDADNNIISNKMQADIFDPDSIVRFRIKEDWIFDKQRSVFEPRIISIAPLIKPKGTDDALGYTPAFWIYFPDARKILTRKPIANNNNDATGLSYDDAFMKRMFAGYIIKQSNNADERIKDYAKGTDRLYEAQRIKKQLMDWELDLWQY